MVFPLLAALAVSQVGRDCETLEARMSRSAMAFTGVVLEARDAADAPSRGSRGVLRIRVDETWKGKPGKTIELAYESPNWGGGGSYADWASRRLAVVWFVDDATRWTSLRLEKNPPASGGNGGYYDLPVLSMRLAVLRTPADVRRAARAFAARARENPPTKTYDATGALPNLVGIWADGYGLALPLVPEMVPTALALIEKPLGFLDRRIPRFDDEFEADRLRRIGTDLLGRFKTPKNVARLRAMLGNRTVQTTKEGRRTYPVREAAYGILRGWGVDVAAPMPYQSDPGGVPEDSRAVEDPRKEAE